MAEAIRAGEVVVTSTAERERLDSRELVAKALEVWPLDAIEEALGADADRILPPALRLVDLHVRIPRVYAAMLEHFAEVKRISVSAILTRTLDGMASARSRELSRRIAGFAAALKWPAA